jgi:hypothetical protein
MRGPRSSFAGVKSTAINAMDQIPEVMLARIATAQIDCEARAERLVEANVCNKDLARLLPNYNMGLKSGT